MKLGPDTKIKKVVDAHPFVRGFLGRYNAHFKAIENPVLWKTVGRFATLSRAAVMGGVPLPELLRAIAAEIAARTGEKVEVEGQAEAAASREETLKGIIRDLHRTENVAAAKERFRELVKDVAPWEIGRMEQSLMAEGLPEAEVKRLCNVHVEVFKESLDGKTVPGLPAGHPVHTLMRENREAERIAAALEAAKGAGEAAAALARLAEIDRHFLRKENQLSPVLEAKGVAGPSKVMWAVHDDIRILLKDARVAAAERKLPADRLKFQTLVDVMTDKATVEVPSPVAGRVLALSGNAGDKLAVGSELIRLAVDDAAIDAPGHAVVDARASTAAPATTATPAVPAAGGKPLASPSVRRQARELSVDLAQVPGSGPDGRVLHEDVVRFAASHDIALVPRGGAASYTDGHLPSTPNSLIIDTARLDRIVEINEQDMYVVVEPGVTWHDLWAALKSKGLRTSFWGPFSWLKATVGGSASQNAASLGSGNYGISADAMLGFEIVLASGESLRTGAAAAVNGVPFCSAGTARTSRACSAVAPVRWASRRASACG